MKLKCVLLFLIAVSTVSAANREQVDVISVEYPPYTSKKMDGYGDVIRLMNIYAQEHLKVDIKPRFLPPARADKVIQDGHWCLSTYPPKQNYKGAKFVPLSDERVVLTLIRVTRNEAFEWNELSEFEGKYVALLRSKTQTALQAKMIEAGLRLVYVGNLEQGLSMLLKQRVDFVLGDKKIMMESKVGQLNKEKLQISTSALHEADIGFFYNTTCQNKIFGTLAP